MSKRNKIRILSIDGGGIRGIIPAYTLVQVENKLKELSGNPDARIADYFDLFVGTSTGAILASMLLVPDENGRPKFTALDVYDLYMQRGNYIFNQAKEGGLISRALFSAAQYDESHIEKIFLEKLGDLRLSQLLKPCIIPTYDMVRKSSYFFNSGQACAENADFFLRDVLRSTSAAPTYFTPAIIESTPETHQAISMVNLDGGVFANNPAMCAYAEARKTDFSDWEDENNPSKKYPTARNMMLLSLGTGGGFMELEDPKESPDWNLITWASNVPNIMMDGGLDTVNYQTKMLFSSLDKDEEIKNFKRVDFEKSALDEKPPYAPDMADASVENMQDLASAAAETYARANAEKPHEWTMNTYVQKLVDIGNQLDEGIDRGILV